MMLTRMSSISRILKTPSSLICFHRAVTAADIDDPGLDCRPHDLSVRAEGDVVGHAFGWTFDDPHGTGCDIHRIERLTEHAASVELSIGSKADTVNAMER